CRLKSTGGFGTSRWQLCTSLHQVARAENGSMSLIGPKQPTWDVRSTSALREWSGLVLLVLSSSGCDPNRSSRVSSVHPKPWYELCHTRWNGAAGHSHVDSV